MILHVAKRQIAGQGLEEAFRLFQFDFELATNAAVANSQKEPNQRLVETSSVRDHRLEVGIGSILEPDKVAICREVQANPISQEPTVAGQQAMAVKPQVYPITRVCLLPDRNISQTPDTDGADPNEKQLLAGQRLRGRFDPTWDESLKAVAQGFRILIGSEIRNEVMNERRRP